MVTMMKWKGNFLSYDCRIQQFLCTLQLIQLPDSKKAALYHFERMYSEVDFVHTPLRSE